MRAHQARPPLEQNQDPGGYGCGFTQLLSQLKFQALTLVLKTLSACFGKLLKSRVLKKWKRG